jgi:hypothetical protein
VGWEPPTSYNFLAIWVWDGCLKIGHREWGPSLILILEMPIVGVKFLTLWFTPWLKHTVDGCEILHKLIDGLSMFILDLSHYLWGVKHPFGAGFRNHPR